ncbi:MAG: hypothetical protein Q8R67_25940 [Rhodoferax sp.]|nr:hypothetical protein [Rhodoferax sp.]MDP3655114.1 hypothetical protein [Rhodoferax sp.]
MLLHKKIISGIGLLGLAFGCAAATLGRAQGTVWIGSPLNLAVQVQFSDEENVSSACVEADVFHADARLDTSRIHIAVEPGAQAQVGVVRITSSIPVDEPVVTVYLRAGCLQKSSRRYVLLAELPSDVAIPTSVALPSRVTALPLAPRTDAPAHTVSSAAVTSKPIPPSPRPERKSRPASDQEQIQKADKVAYKAAESVQSTQRVTAPASTQFARASGKSRLKLDLLDLVEERDPALKSSAELSILPTDNLQIRAEAAALWRALNASPEEVLRQAARVQQMASEVDTLKTLTTQNQRGLADLEARLQKAEAERYANWLVYVLSALLLTMLTALALLWRRRVPQNDPALWHSAQPKTPPTGELDLDLDLDIPAPQAPSKAPE